MKINKTDLQTALETVRPGLANKEIIEQSTHFAFLGNKVVTYDDEISITHPVEGLDLKGAVRAQELYEFVKRAQKDEIEVEQKENELLLKSGHSKAGLAFQSEVMLPLEEISQTKDWKDLPEEFCDTLMFVKDSASRDMSRRILTCAHITDTFVEASDSFQIMRVYDDSWPFTKDCLLPAENIPEINKVKPNQVTVSDGWLHFRNAEGTELSCRIIADQFPDTSDHFAVEGNKVKFPKSMDGILERVMVFTKKDHYMDEEMEVSLKDDKITVYGKNEYGWFKERAKVKYEGEEGKFWITPSLLQNILSRSNECLLGEEKIKFEGSEGDWEYVAVLKN